MICKAVLGNSLPMRTPATLFLLFLAVGVSSIPQAQARNLFLHVTIDMEPGLTGETVVVSGRVTDDGGAFVPGAAISAQVNNPLGTIIVASFTYTGSDGSYSLTFRLTADSPEGNYTVYLTASRSGYENDRAKLNFSLRSAEFTIMASPRTASVQQGKSVVYELAVDTKNQTKSPVTFGLLNLPPSINYTFRPSSVKPPGSTTLTIAAAEDTPTGLYNVTVLASSGAKVRRTTIILIVNQAFIPFVFSGVNPFVMAGAIGLTGILAAIAIRGLMAQRGSAGSAAVDREYLATARALARLEEMRAHGKIDEATYERLKKEYEEKMARGRR